MGVCVCVCVEGVMRQLRRDGVSEMKSASVQR